MRLLNIGFVNWYIGVIEQRECPYLIVLQSYAEPIYTQNNSKYQCQFYSPEAF